MGFEYNIIKFFQSNATTGWITFFQIVTLLGSYLGFLLTFILVFLKDRKLSLALLMTFIIGSVVNFLLKLIIRRDRPFVSYDDILNYGNETGCSMPSGHSLCAGIFATYLIYTLFVVRKDWWTRMLGTFALTLFPMLIALSRMVLGAHYFTDTLLGLSLGIIFAVFSILLYRFIMKKYGYKLKNFM